MQQQQQQQQQQNWINQELSWFYRQTFYIAFITPTSCKQYMWFCSYYLTLPSSHSDQRFYIHTYTLQLCLNNSVESREKKSQKVWGGREGGRGARDPDCTHKISVFFLSVYDQWPFYLPVLEQNPREKPVITEIVCIHILSHKCNCFLFVCASLCAIVTQSFIFLCAETCFVLIFLTCILFRFFSSLLRVEEQVLYAGKSMNQQLD